MNGERSVRRVVLGMACAFAVAVVAASVVQAAVSCTITTRDGSVTVELGGGGGDNVQGTVSDRSGAPVPGAEVDIHNRTKDETNDDQTNRNGWYDMDVDAEAGDVIDIFATWTDARGTKYDVQGTCTLK